MNKRNLWLIITAGVVGFISGPAGAAETNMYHTNRVFTPVAIHVPDNPTVDQIYTEAMKLTEIVPAGTNITINSNETYAIEKQVINLCYKSATDAWNSAVSYNATTNGLELHHPGEIYDNVGWVRGTVSTIPGEWGSYIYSLRNHIAFKSSQTNWYRSPSNGVPVEIAKVMVGTLGDYAPMEDVVDVGPSLDAATNNFPGENTGEDKIFRADITNVYYQLIIPFIWITPRVTYVAAGGSNVQYTVTGTNISNGVTWTISPSGLSGGATIQPSNDWHYAGVTPGTVATNYKVRATSVDNTNFSAEVDLAVVKVDIVETNIYIAVANTTSLHLTSNSSANVQWVITPEMQDSASIEGSAVGTSVVINAGTIATNYTIIASAMNLTNCYDTCTVTVVKIEITELSFTNDYVIYNISDPVWKKESNPDYPACYKKDTNLTMNVKLAITPSLPNPVTISLKADGPGDLDAQKDSISISGSEATVNGITTTGKLDNIIYSTTPSFTWNFSMDGTNWSSAGSSGPHKLYAIYSSPTCGDANFKTSNIDRAVGKATGESTEGGIASEANDNVGDDVYEGCICEDGFQKNFDAAMDNYPTNGYRGMCCCRAEGLNCILNVLGIGPYSHDYVNELPEPNFTGSRPDDQYCTNCVAWCYRKYWDGFWNNWEGVVKAGGNGSTCYAPANGSISIDEGTYSQIDSAIANDCGYYWAWGENFENNCPHLPAP